MNRNKINPLKRLLADRIQKHQKALSEWHLSYAKKAPPPFYCSVDLRDSGHKIAPVDSNLYPAGFNNLCPDDRRSAPPILRAQVEAIATHIAQDTPKKILILPEAHTQNTFYIENLFYLRELLINAGFETAIGWYPDAPSPITLTSASGKILEAHPLKIKDGRAMTDDFIPDWILLNNDFSSGYPKPLDSLRQPILPSHVLGWHSRKKSEHFTHYNHLAHEFASILDVDPWLIQIDTEEVGPVNFNQEEGIESVANTAARILERTQAAYAAHQVEQKPFVFIKNNHGTYGIGIMVIRSPDELRQMNRRTKNKMSVGKNHLPIDSVVVQEGIPTATLVDRLAAEPVIYLAGCELIGGFLRTNTEKNTEENLNSAGMVFKMLCMSDLRQGEEATLELVYGSIARISALATGLELAEHLNLVNLVNPEAKTKSQKTGALL